MTAAATVTIRTWDEDSGRFRDQDAAAVDCGVPGLAVHRAYEADGWVITHAPTGFRIAWFPDPGAGEAILGLAWALGELGDWTGIPGPELRRRAAVVVAASGADMTAATVPAAAKRAEWERALGPGAA